MSETTSSSRPAEPYVPSFTLPNGAATTVERTAALITASSDLDEAWSLLLRGQQLLQESKAAEAEPLLLRVVELYERQGTIPAECVQVHFELASIAMTRADFSAAELHLQRALTLANACLTPEHPDIATILGGLARLHLRRSEFTRAEPLLRRLLEIKRVRGDDHPEVATVLASLATVHSATGAHESAERMLRRVLAIREKTLAPNHFAVVTTLEHLAEACAARGKLEEALALLRRALGHRQRALGVSHPSMASARARIADLELLLSNEELGATPAIPPTLGTLPQMEGPAESPVDSDEPPAKPVEVSETPARKVAYVPSEEWQDPYEEVPRKPRTRDQLGSKAALITAFARTPRGRVTVLTIGVTSLLAALVLAVQTRADVVGPPFKQFSVASGSATTARPRSDNPIGVNVTALPPTAPAPPSVVRNIESPRPPATAIPNERRSLRSTEVNAIDQDAAPIPLPNAPRVGGLEVPLAGMTITPVPGAAVAVDFASPESASAQTVSLRATSPGSTGFVHATLPAGNPAPKYPPDLLRRRVEGRVMAEFLVDANGRADVRTLRIVSSPDEQFSQAVGAVLPRLRFLPAERDGTKIEEWVAMPFRFSLDSPSAQKRP
jgi:TonB family protein